MKKHCTAFLIVIFIVMLLAGCSGGGGGGGGGGGATLSNEKAITAFLFTSPAATATIDQSAKKILVKVNVPYRMNITALVATFSTTGQSVAVGSTVQVSGVTPNNFTSPVTYTVTAVDGSTQNYTVTIIANTFPAPSYPPEVTSFVRPSEAAYLVVQTALGDTVKLEMPQGALASAQSVTLRVLDVRPDSPFRTSALLPGVAIEPDGLVLVRGARLRIDLTNPLQKPLATAIAWIRGPNDALLVANPSSGDRRVEGNLRHFSAYQPVDLGVAAAAGELASVSTPTPQDYGGFVDAAIDAQAKAVLARAFCAGLASCTLGDPATHDARASSLLSAGIDVLLGDVNPADACGSYLANLYEALNAVASLVGATDIAAALRDRIQVLEAQCCAPNTCSPVCPSCPDQGHWTIQWYKSGGASLLETNDSPGQRIDCLHLWSNTGGGFAEIQYGTGYVSAFSMTGNWKEEQTTTTTYSGCASGGSVAWTKGSCALNANGVSQTEYAFSGLFGFEQGRVSYIQNPFTEYAGVDADCSNEIHTEEDYVDCDGVPHSLNETNTTNSVGPYYLPGLGANGLFPVDAAGLIYSMTETRDRLTGCWGPGVNSPITYDIEAAWTDASSQGPPPPSCRGVTCQAGDPRCNDPGVCNPATGTCSPPKVRAGASCGGDYCTAAGTCDAQGTCVPGTEIPRCPVTDPECGGVVCVPATGACIYMANGQSCDDHNACTINDTCNKGTCLGTPQPCASEKKECYAAPQCDPALGCQPPLALVKGTRCNSGSVCYECNGGKCDPLSQSTVDMGCDQLIDETIKTCKESNNNTWRVDARTSAHGGTNYVACEETGGKKQIVDDWETNICSHAGGGERQTDYYCTGSIISKSAASDTQCARARDTTQGVCDAVCTVCVP